MEETRESLLERLLNTYSNWYNIERCGEEAAPLMAKGTFAEHGVGYLLIKKAQTYTADSYEYVWFFSVPHLTKELYEQCLKTTVDEGTPMVKPVKGHKSTYLVCEILCDTADEEALKALKKCRISKSFQFSLKGWMEVHTAAIEVGKASVTTNPAARNTAKFLKSILTRGERKHLSVLREKNKE